MGMNESTTVNSNIPKDTKLSDFANGVTRRENAMRE